MTDYKFPDGSVEAFFEKFPIEEVDGKRTITGEPETFVEHLLYRLSYSLLVMSREEN